MELERALQNLGMSQKESKVYLALLPLGESSAYVVSQKSGLKKPTTYAVLDELVKKGIVVNIPDANKKLYRVKPPEEIFKEARERLKSMESVLLELKALSRTGNDKLQTLYFEGLSGMREMLWHRVKEMEGGSVVGFYGGFSEPSAELKKLFLEWKKEMKRKGVAMSGIAHPRSPFSWKVGEGGTFVHDVKNVSEEEYSSSVSVEVGDTFVRITALQSLQGAIIENKEVAESFRSIFKRAKINHSTPD